MAKNSWIAILAVLGLITVAGCNAPAKTDPVKPPETTGEPKSDGTSLAQDPGEANTPEKKIEVPAELKGLAYEYYGLGAAKPITYYMVSPASIGDSTIENVVTEVKDGTATIRQTRKGVGESQAKDTTLLLKKDGLYSTEFNGIPLDPPVLELPNDLKQGKVYTAKAKVTSSGQAIEIDVSNKVVGFEKVKTKRGSFDAMRIKTTGTIKFGTEKAGLIVDQWLVKGLGVVKYIAKTTLPTGVQTATMDITKE